MIKKLAVTSTLLAVGFISSLGYAAVAQTDRPTTSPNQSAPMPNQPTQRSNSRQARVSDLDRQFVMGAAQGGMAEVRLSELALERSTNPEVKEFAQHMIEEHTRVNQQLMRLAAQKGITPPTALAPKHEAAMKQLSQLSGDSFDQAYMSEGGINAHLENTAVFQRQAAMGQDPDLKAFAAQILPRVHTHLEMASAMTGYRFAQRSDADTMRSQPGMNRSQPGTNRSQSGGMNHSQPGMNHSQPGGMNQSQPGMRMNQ
jgi:putative membrane protein